MEKNGAPSSPHSPLRNESKMDLFQDLKWWSCPAYFILFYFFTFKQCPPTSVLSRSSRDIHAFMTFQPHVKWVFFFFLVARGTRLCSLESPSPKILLREGNLFFGALFEIEIKYSEIQENDFQLLQTRMHAPPTHSQDHLLFEKSLLVFSHFFLFFCLFFDPRVISGLIVCCFLSI